MINIDINHIYINHIDMINIFIDINHIYKVPLVTLRSHIHRFQGLGMDTFGGILF